MKINETKKDHIDEGPLDILTKSGRAQKRSFKSGSRNLKRTVDNLKNEFATYLGGQGKRNFKQATTQDVIDFLDTKQVDTSNIGPAGMTPQRMHDIFVAKSKEAILGKGGKKIPQQTQTEPAKVSSAYVQTKDAALKLNAKEKDRLIKALDKSIKRKTTKKDTVVDKNFDKSQRLSQYGKVGS